MQHGPRARPDRLRREQRHHRSRLGGSSGQALHRCQFKCKSFQIRLWLACPVERQAQRRDAGEVETTRMVQAAKSASIAVVSNTASSSSEGWLRRKIG